MVVDAAAAIEEQTVNEIVQPNRVFWRLPQFVLHGKVVQGE